MTGLANRSKLGLSELVIILPVFHLAVSSLFLIGYYTAYGDRVATFSGPSDLFSLSLVDVGPSYIITLALPIAYLAYMRTKHGGWTMSEAISLKDEPERKIAEADLPTIKKFWAAVLTIVVLAQIIVLAIYYVRLGYIVYGLMYGPLLSLYMIANVWITNKIQTSGLAFQMSFLIGAVVISSGTNGLSKGQFDRMASYSEIASRSPTCGEFALLRPLSSFYLAVHRNGQRAVIDNDCKALFQLGVAGASGRRVQAKP